MPIKKWRKACGLWRQGSLRRWWWMAGVVGEGSACHVVEAKLREMKVVAVSVGLSIFLRHNRGLYLIIL